MSHSLAANVTLASSNYGSPSAVSSEGQLQMMVTCFRVTAVTVALPGLCLCPVWATDFQWMGERTYCSQLWRRGLKIREHRMNTWWELLTGS